MKCADDLNDLKAKLSLTPLQILNTNNFVSFGTIKILQSSLRCYRAIIYRLHKLDKERWASLFGIGLRELDEHMKILVAASDPDSQSINYHDCHNYLAASIQDAIDTDQDDTLRLYKSLTKF